MKRIIFFALFFLTALTLVAQQKPTRNIGREQTVPLSTATGVPVIVDSSGKKVGRLVNPAEIATSAQMSLKASTTDLGNLNLQLRSDLATKSALDLNSANEAAKRVEGNIRNYNSNVMTYSRQLVARKNFTNNTKIRGLRIGDSNTEGHETTDPIIYQLSTLLENQIGWHNFSGVRAIGMNNNTQTGVWVDRALDAQTDSPSGRQSEGQAGATKTIGGYDKPFDRIDVLYKKNGSSFQYAVNGGAPTVIAPSTGNGVGKFTCVFPTSSTINTMTITVNSGTAILYGSLAYNIADTLTYSRIDRMGVSGSKTIDWVNIINKPNFKVILDSIAPDFITIALGTNDKNQGYSVDTYKSNLSQIVAAYKTACPKADVLLIAPHDDNYTPTLSSTIDSAFDYASKQVAIEQKVGFLSLFELGDWATAKGRGYYSDSLHFNAAGGYIVADLIVKSVFGQSYNTNLSDYVKESSMPNYYANRILFGNGGKTFSDSYNFRYDPLSKYMDLTEGTLLLGDMSVQNKKGIYFHYTDDRWFFGRENTSWAAPNYARIKLSSETGILFDCLNASFAKSFVEIAGAKGLKITGVPIGTAPLEVSSPTKVVNLNADQIDGVDTSQLMLKNAYKRTVTMQLKSYNGGTLDISDAIVIPDELIGSTLKEVKVARIDYTTGGAATTAGTITSSPSGAPRYNQSFSLANGASVTYTPNMVITSTNHRVFNLGAATDAITSVAVTLVFEK